MSTKEDFMKVIKARQDSLPKETGFYWARSEEYSWCNLIVHIKGEIPYLEYIAWNLVDGTLIKGKDPLDLRVIFVRKIEEIEKEDIEFFKSDY